MLAIDLKDKFLLLGSALLALYASYMLVQPIPNSFQSRVTTLPIAQIKTFSNIVKKKPAQSLSWENLNKANQLYQGDQVFTHNESYAEIEYKNSTSINLLPNTLLKIEENSDGFNIDLKKGFFSLNFKDGKTKRVNLKIGKKNLVVSAKNALIQIDSSKSDSNITIIKGKATLKSGATKSESKLLQSGESLKINAKTNKIKISKADMFPSFPKIGETIQMNSSPLNFKWSNKKDFAGNLKLVLSRNSDLSKARTFNVKGSSHKMDYLPPGSYYWQLKARVNNKNVMGPISYFTIPTAKAPKLLSPANGVQQVISASEDFSKVNFKWAGSHPKGYIISLKPEDGPAREIKVLGNQTSLKIKKGSRYTWKTKVNEASSAWSINSNLIITRENFLKSKTKPTKTSFNILSLKESIKFDWKGPKDKAYIVQVFKDQALKNEILKEEVVGNSISLKMKEFGKYYWKVSSKEYPEVGSEALPFSIFASIASLKFPKDKKRYALVDEKQLVKFRWSNLGLKLYPSVLQISKDQDFQDIYLERDVKKKKIALPFNDHGNFYWRIIPKDKSLKNISSSDVRSFSLSLPKPPVAPIIEMEQVLSFLKGYNIEQYVIAWPKSKFSQKYTIEIYEKEDLKTRITKAEVKSTKILWRGERSGAFYYRVKVKDLWDRESGWSKTGKLIAPISPFD